MSQFDGDYAGIEPTKEELLSIEEELDGIADDERPIIFDPDEYEIESNGADAFNLYLYNDNRYDNEEEDEWGRSFTDDYEIVL